MLSGSAPSVSSDYLDDMFYNDHKQKKRMAGVSLDCNDSKRGF